MKQLFLMFFSLTLLLNLNCGGGTAGDDENQLDAVTLSASINQEATELGNFPEDADVADTKMVIDGETVTGTLSVELDETDSSEKNTSADIPADYSAKGLFSAVTVQLWLNGALYAISHDGNSATIPAAVKLKNGSNYFCFVFAASGKKHRTLVIKIKSTTNVTDSSATPGTTDSTSTTTTPKTDTESVAADKASLAIGYSTGDTASSVTNKLTLATSGSNGTAVSWAATYTSGGADASAILSSSGTVTRPTSANAELTLTATITKNAASDTKTFNITVTPFLALRGTGLTSSSGDFYSNAIVTDAAGNTYIAGQINTIGTFNFGNSISLTGKFTGANLFIAKYDSAGICQWAKTLTSATNNSAFYDLAIDSDGNLYAAGTIYDVGEFDFGDGVTCTAPAASNADNLLVVKYNSAGTCLWAKTWDSAATNSKGLGVAVDPVSRDVYVGGWIGVGAHSFTSPALSVTGLVSGSGNFLLAKFSTDGTPQWLKTVSTGSSWSKCEDIAIDSNRDIICVGGIKGDSSYTFQTSPSVTAQGASTGTYDNALVVKYAADGSVYWVETTSAGSLSSYLYGVSVDSGDNFYVCGYIQGTGSYDFGNSVTVAGTYGSASPNNAVIVKYNNSGTAQWAKSTVTGANQSTYLNLKVDRDNQVYVAGWIYGTSTFDFGNSVTVSSTTNNYNGLLIKYNAADGNALLAKAVSGGSLLSAFDDLAVDAENNIHVTGRITGTSTYTFSPSVTVTGTATGNNLFLVKYR